MSNTSKFLILFLSIIFFACKPQKGVIEYKYLSKTDTLVRSEINTIYKGVVDTILVDNICDSSGIINSFYSKLILPNGELIIKSNKKSNKLEAEVKLNDIKTSDLSEKSISKLTDISSKSKEIIKYRIPNWIIFALFLETFIIIVYAYLKFGLKFPFFK